MKRTIIDILNKGNLELFHSSMIAWMLDPSRSDEHGLGRRFLEAFADRAGNDRVRQIVGQGDEPLIEIEKRDKVLAKDTEDATKTPKKKKWCRYDIAISQGDGKLVAVIENKIKSIGGKDQLDTYRGQVPIVIPLGWCDISFDLRGRHYSPVSYSSIRDILTDLTGEPSSKYSILVRDYA